jgi:hypothetical protein
VVFVKVGIKLGLIIIFSLVIFVLFSSIIGGGKCYYDTYHGTCKVTSNVGSFVKFHFSPQDPLMSSKAPHFNMSKEYSGYYHNSTEAAKFSVNGTYTCTVDVQTQGGCNPTIFRLS